LKYTFYNTFFLRGLCHTPSPPPSQKKKKKKGNSPFFVGIIVGGSKDIRKGKLQEWDSKSLTLLCLGDKLGLSVSRRIAKELEMRW